MADRERDLPWDSWLEWLGPAAPDCSCARGRRPLQKSAAAAAPPGACARSPVGWFDLQKFRNAALDTCRRTLGEEDRNISSRYEQVSLVRGNMFFRGKLQVCVILGFFPQLVKLQVVGTLNI